MPTCGRFNRSGILHLVLLMVVCVGCGPERLAAPPDEIIGTWRTEAPGYERSYLTIESELIVIGMDPFELYRYPIDRVEHSHDERGHDRYELHYIAAEGYADSIQVTLESGSPPTISLRHPAYEWRRES